MSDETKGGRWATRAAMLCRESDFMIYLDHRKRYRLALTIEQLPDGTHTAQDAADALRQACGVASRAELDHNQAATAMFRRIAGDYARWKRRVGR